VHGNNSRVLGTGPESRDGDLALVCGICKS